MGENNISLKSNLSLFCLISLLIVPLSIQAATGSLVWSSEKIEITKKPCQVIESGVDFTSKANLRKIVFETSTDLRTSMAIVNSFFHAITRKAHTPYTLDLIIFEQRAGFYQGRVDYKQWRGKNIYEGLEIDINVDPNAPNQPPTADAGTDQTLFIGSTVQLDGSGSEDQDGSVRFLLYNWSFVSMPEDSEAELSDPTAVNPTFTPDKPGIYEIQLIVNDNCVDSEPAMVIVEAEYGLMCVKSLNGEPWECMPIIETP